MQHRRHISAAVRRILLRDKAILPPWLRTLIAPLWRFTHHKMIALKLHNKKPPPLAGALGSKQGSSTHGEGLQLGGEFAQLADRAEGGSHAKEG